MIKAHYIERDNDLTISEGTVRSNKTNIIYYTITKEINCLMTRSPFMLWLFLLSVIALPAYAQTNAGYQEPTKVIKDLVDAPLTPILSISPDKSHMAILTRPSYPSIEEVAQKELRIAGIRINPRTNGSSRGSYYDGVYFQSMEDTKQILIAGLPKGLKLQNVLWSPSGKHVAATNAVEEGLELWIIDVAKASASKVTEPVINDAISGIPFTWLNDNQLLYKAILEDRPDTPKSPSATTGPVIQENNGTEAAVRTYQDLLQNAYDEYLFDYYTQAQLMVFDLEGNTHQAYAEPGIYLQMDPSPDGQFLLLSKIKKPYSYLVPYYRFPQQVSIYDMGGKLVHEIAQIPLAENIPKGFGATRTGPRNFDWRTDAPATLYWVEAQDGGDPKAQVEIRDRLFSISAPFTEKPQPAIDFKLRFGGVEWGSDNLAIAYENWWSSRHQIISKWTPSKPAGSKQILFDRSTEDRYNDPGRFQKERNSFGESVLMTKDNGSTLFLVGTGASPEGNRPFIDEYHVQDGSTKRLWRSKAPYYEKPVTILDKSAGRFITSRQSKEEPANYFLRDLTQDASTQITFFEHPFKALKGVTKELIKYYREDSVALTGTLYLPAGYDKEKDGPLPTLMWAYPREYKSAKAASQVSGSPHQFVRLYYGSPIFWVTQGYAVFDNFAMPIIGEGDEEPNETFVQQLTSGAEAAINKLVDMGVTDRSRIGVGGHSYGAFMTANLLAHTDLFAAGIARSGAYNRTLTPFGFQREERTFWEAPEIYFKMSPFMHADKIKEPILLVHGEADNNSGTFPMQSKRFYAALKGHGGTARLVMLPHESHGYRGRESILHMLWEMDTWLDKHVKNAPAEQAKVKP